MRDSYTALFMFIGFMMALGILWLLTGGPERAPSSTFSGFPKAQLIEQFDERSTKLTGVGSPYRGKISFSGGNPREPFAQDEYIRLRAGRGNEEDILITGWKIESVLTGVQVTLGGASPLPAIGNINSEPVLRLPPGGEVIIHSGRSPVGASFRVNRCTGYFNQYQPFNPDLPRECPAPVDEFDEFSGITAQDIREDARDTCRAYIRRNTERCEIDDTANFDARNRFGERVIDPPLSPACQTFIRNELTYAGCVANHIADEDFYSLEWHVYAGSFNELWRKEGEVLRLLDQNGRTVDVWNY